MKFSESIALRLPKRTVNSRDYTILARSRYNRRDGIHRIERINPDELAHAPDILQKLGFVVVRNVLTDSDATRVRSTGLRNKGLVSALEQAWERITPEHTSKKPRISYSSTEPGAGVRLTQSGVGMIAPSDRQTLAVTKSWHYAQTELRPGDALVWTQHEDSYFPSVELHNTSRYYAGAFILHESVMYDEPPVAPGPPSVSQ